MVKKDKGGELTTGKKVFDVGKFKQKKPAAISAEERIKTYTTLQVLVMFDITASMFSWFDIVREKLREIVMFVKEEVKTAQFAIFAYRNHGDEGGYDKIYYISELTGDVEKIRKTIDSIEKGGGGPDALTCMEDCLKEATKLQWLPQAAKAIVVVGDMPPHGVLDSVGACPNDINYKFELDNLVRRGINFYPVFAGYHEQVREFYKSMVKGNKGKYLEIKDIDLIVDLLKGICIKETGNVKDFMVKLKKSKQITAEHEKKIMKLLE